MSGVGTFIIVCYTALGLGVVGLVHYLLRRWRWRWLVATPLLLGVITLAVAPYIEEAHIAAQFEELCKDAGIHVKRKVQAPGYYDSFLGSGYSEIKRRGWDYMEHSTGADKAITHIELVDGQWQATIVERPMARYHLIESRPHLWVGHRVDVNELAIIDSQTGEMIARDTTYHRIANTVDQAWMGLLGSTLRTCRGTREGQRGFLVDQTITPTKR